MPKEQNFTVVHEVVAFYTNTIIILNAENLDLQISTGVTFNYILLHEFSFELTIVISRKTRFFNSLSQSFCDDTVVILTAPFPRHFVIEIYLEFNLDYAARINIISKLKSSDVLLQLNWFVSIISILYLILFRISSA